jgi:hypothetical protein
MPVQLSTIFSTGQHQKKSNKPSGSTASPPSGGITSQGQQEAYSLSTESRGGGDAPIWMSSVAEFGPEQPARQSTSSQAQLFGDLARNAAIPRGARLRPRLKLEGSRRTPRLKTRQLWEGTVTEVLQNGFVAVLRDKTNPTNPDEQATFDFDNSELSADDFTMVNPGASFYWIIGNERTAAGQVKNVSMVQFRRLPRWTQRNLERVATRARQIRELFQD